MMKDRILKVKQRVRESRYAGVLLNFPLRTTGRTLLFIILGSLLVVKVLAWIPGRDFFTILPALKLVILALFISGVLILSFQKELKINENQGVINIILIIGTLIFTFSVYFIDKQNSFYNTNTYLVRVNEINADIARTVIEKDYSKGYPWTFFITDPYERNIAFISKNFSSTDCVLNYYRIMLSMRILNDVHTSIATNSVKEESVDELIQNSANFVRSSIEEILKNCHTDK